MKRKKNCKLDSVNNIRTKFENKYGFVCLLHKQADGISRCRMDQINANREGNYYRLAPERLISKLCDDQNVKLRLEQGGGKKGRYWKSSQTRVLFVVTDYI